MEGDSIFSHEPLTAASDTQVEHPGDGPMASLMRRIKRNLVCQYEISDFQLNREASSLRGANFEKVKFSVGSPLPERLTKCCLAYNRVPENQQKSLVEWNSENRSCQQNFQVFLKIRIIRILRGAILRKTDPTAYCSSI